MMKVLKVIPVAALVAITSTDSAFAADPPKDGDKRLTYFWYGSDGKLVREAVIGTGKNEGLVASGTEQTFCPIPVT
jgi:hypothetical protein